MKFDLPTIVLFLLLLLALFVLWRAAKRNDFNLGNMLRDDAGKESALRLAVLVSLAVSSWVVIYQTIGGTIDPQTMWGYLMTWSGALVFAKAAEKWDGKLPWTTH